RHDDVFLAARLAIAVEFANATCIPGSLRRCVPRGSHSKTESGEHGSKAQCECSSSGGEIHICAPFGFRFLMISKLQRWLNGCRQTAILVNGASLLSFPFVGVEWKREEST